MCRQAAYAKWVAPNTGAKNVLALCIVWILYCTVLLMVVTGLTNPHKLELGLLILFHCFVFSIEGHS